MMKSKQNTRIIYKITRYILFTVIAIIAIIHSDKQSNNRQQIKPVFQTEISVNN